ncbi:hypothetical protein BC628DRAFT_17787 [Trametes gibbosa]|nr:hypothetical protein BC628DRAFT_17787 [Trametes gibbosa]
MNAMQLSVLLDIPEPAPPPPPPPEEPEVEEDEDEDLAQSVVSDWALDEQMADEVDEEDHTEAASEGAEHPAEDEGAFTGIPPVGGALGLDTTGGQQQQPQETPQSEPISEQTENPAAEADRDLDEEDSTSVPVFVAEHEDSDVQRSVPLHDSPSAQEDGGEGEEPAPSQPGTSDPSSQDAASSTAQPGAETEATTPKESPESEDSAPATFSAEVPISSREHHTTTKGFITETGARSTELPDKHEGVESAHEVPLESEPTTEEPPAEDSTLAKPAEAAAHVVDAEEARLDQGREGQSSEAPAGSECRETPAPGEDELEEDPPATSVPAPTEEGNSTSGQDQASERPLVKLDDDSENSETDAFHDTTTAFPETPNEAEATKETSVERPSAMEEALVPDSDSPHSDTPAEGATATLVDFSTDEPAPASEPPHTATPGADDHNATDQSAVGNNERTTATRAQDTTPTPKPTSDTTPASESSSESLSSAPPAAPTATAIPPPQLTVDISASQSEATAPPTPTTTQDGGSRTSSSRERQARKNKSRAQTPVTSQPATPVRVASPALSKAASVSSPSPSASSSQATPVDPQEGHQEDEHEDQQDDQKDERQTAEASALEVDADETHDDGVIVSPVTPEYSADEVEDTNGRDAESAPPSSSQEHAEDAEIELGWEHVDPQDASSQESTQEPAQDHDGSQAQAQVNLDGTQASSQREDGEGTSSAREQDQTKPQDGDQEGGDDDDEDDDDEDENGPKVGAGNSAATAKTKKKVEEVR